MENSGSLEVHRRFKNELLSTHKKIPKSRLFDFLFDIKKVRFFVSRTFDLLSKGEYILIIEASDWKFTHFWKEIAQKISYIPPPTVEVAHFFGFFEYTIDGCYIFFSGDFFIHRKSGTLGITVRLRRGLTPRSVDSKSKDATF